MGAVVFVIVAAVVVVVGGYSLSYNRLVHGRNAVTTSWATVDAELQRRHELVPRLVEAVRASASHEQELLTRAVEAATRARAGAHTATEASRVEPSVASAASALVALRERYPELNSQQNFLGLQRDLTTTEDRIAAARRYYNTVVRNYNTRCSAFPSALVARRHQFAAAEFFDADAA